MSHIQIPLNKITLEGELLIPEGARGIVLFAHGSGSSRFSPRNQFVAKFLRQHNLATLLIDLLTAEEEAVDQYSREIRFNIPLLADRLVGITDWLLQESQTKNLLLGYFGSSTGAAGALTAAAKKQKNVAAVVSRGGRPDLVLSVLSQVKAPTLLIVGERDEVVIELNEQAFEELTCEKDLRVVAKATHLFEEPGTLEEVAELTTNWFRRHLDKVIRTP
jgi:putative phosphoribosyl transferase